MEDSKLMEYFKRGYATGKDIITSPFKDLSKVIGYAVEDAKKIVTTPIKVVNKAQSSILILAGLVVLGLYFYTKTKK